MASRWSRESPLVATMTGAGPTHQHLHEIGQRPAAPGDAVPEVNLLAEDGSEISLDEAVGEEAVLVFWRVDCGFCQRMLDDLRVLEEDVTVRLVTGSDLAAIRESGLVSPVLRDRDGALERWLQVPGTPSAARVRDTPNSWASTMSMRSPSRLSGTGRLRWSTVVTRRPRPSPAARRGCRRARSRAGPAPGSCRHRR